MKFKIFGKTDTGRVREHNEDDFAICKDLSTREWTFNKDEIRTLSDKGTILAVADGMGGENAGEVASEIAQLTVRKEFEKLERVPTSYARREQFLRYCIRKAHDAVVAHQMEHIETAGMGCTLIIGWVIENVVHVAWAGDSRCYIFNKGEGKLAPFTDDHSMIWQLVMAGQMTPEQARLHPDSNIVTQSLGDQKNPPKPQSKTEKLYRGSRLLFCSDGLNGMLSDEQIKSVLETGMPNDETCKKLVDMANEAGGEDNITCLLLDVTDGPKPPSFYVNENVNLLSRFYYELNFGQKTAAIAMIFFIITAGSFLGYHFMQSDVEHTTGIDIQSRLQDYWLTGDDLTATEFLIREYEIADSVDIRATLSRNDSLSAEWIQTGNSLRAERLLFQSYTLAGLTGFYDFKHDMLNRLKAIDDFTCGMNIYDDSTIYRTISIQNDCWMADNLKEIPSDSTLCEYNEGHEITNCDIIRLSSEDNSDVHFFYNANVLNEQTAICPLGWDYPTLADWQNIGYPLEEDGRLFDDFTLNDLNGYISVTQNLPMRYDIGRSYWWSNDHNVLTYTSTSDNRILDGNEIADIEHAGQLFLGIRCLKKAE